MTNEERAKELLGAPIRWTFNYWLDGFSEATQKELREKRNLLMQMAEWKDQQFKEYLEKRRNKIAEIDTKDYKGWEMSYMADITEIINELFKED